jgi:protein-disulfide isomerase
MTRRSAVSRVLRPGLGAAALFALTLACGAAPPADARDASTPAEAPAAPAAKVLAKVGDLEITEAEVAVAAGAQLRQLDQRRHELLEQALTGVIDQKLVELEAKKRGVSADQLLAQEVGSKVPPVTDAEVDAFYEERKAQIPQPKEAIADRIRQFLAQNREREVYTSFVAGLRSSYPVKNMFEPMRVTVAAEGPAKGPADAPVTIVEFSDFECPFCSRVVPALDEVVSHYGDKVRLVFRQYPLNSIHPNAQKAAEASLCAADQGKFWELHDAMFADQRGLGLEQLKAKAATVGLDAAAFAACLDGGSKAAIVAKDVADGNEAGVSGTPAIFVNGRFLNGAVPYEDLAKVIDDELGRKGIAPPAKSAAK